TTTWCRRPSPSVMSASSRARPLSPLDLPPRPDVVGRTRWWACWSRGFSSAWRVRLCLLIEEVHDRRVIFGILERRCVADQGADAFTLGARSVTDGHGTESLDAHVRH